MTIKAVIFIREIFVIKTELTTFTASFLFFTRHDPMAIPQTPETLRDGESRLTDRV